MSFFSVKGTVLYDIYLYMSFMSLLWNKNNRFFFFFGLGVGKSSLLLRFADNTFSGMYKIIFLPYAELSTFTSLGITNLTLAYSYTSLDSILNAAYTTPISCLDRDCKNAPRAVSYMSSLLY